MKPKIPATRILSDDCAISIGQVITDGEITDPGVAHYVHQDEWVEVLPIMTVKEVVQLSRLQAGADDTAGVGDNLARLCEEMSKRVIAWNWTDIMGEEMEQPYNRPDVLENLSSDELLWLVNAASSQEAPGERKKDSGPSEITSSEMALNLEQ